MRSSLCLQCKRLRRIALPVPPSRRFIQSRPHWLCCTNWFVETDPQCSNTKSSMLAKDRGVRTSPGLRSLSQDRTQCVYLRELSHKQERTVSNVRMESARTEVQDSWLARCHAKSACLLEPLNLVQTQYGEVHHTCTPDRSIASARLHSRVSSSL
jgi:hypothetical protein